MQAKCANIVWLSGRHVAEMSATSPAKLFGQIHNLLFVAVFLTLFVSFTSTNIDFIIFIFIVIRAT